MQKFLPFVFVKIFIIELPKLNIVSFCFAKNHLTENTVCCYCINNKNVSLEYVSQLMNARNKFHVHKSINQN